MTNPADNTPWCRVCGLAFQVRGCTAERCADPPSAAKKAPDELAMWPRKFVSRAELMETYPMSDEKTRAFQDELARAAEGHYRVIMAARERYLQAWIAETGLKPSESMLVEQRHADGRTILTVERRGGPALDAQAMLGLLRQWVTGSATWQDLADAREMVLRHAPGTKLDALPDPPPHPAVALLSEALDWLEDPSGYAQDRARDFDTRARALLDKHGRAP